MSRENLSLMAACLAVLVSPLRAELRLARDGATDYVVIPPGAPSPVDTYAVNVLTNFLQQKTGAVFPVVPGTDFTKRQASDGPSAIFVGVSAPMTASLGEADPLAGMRDQDHVARGTGNDIYLYGKGLHGNLYAVLDFMETSLGRRWYTRFEQPVFAVERDPALAPFARRRSVSFASRQGLWHCNEFDYQHGMNVRFSERNAEYKDRYGKTLFPPGFVSGGLRCGGVHSLHQYIPPNPESHLWPTYQWIETRDYFATHPEFFSMNSSGSRVPSRQLCFSNPELRRVFSSNVCEHIKREGEDFMVTLGAEDTGGAFCECAPCRRLAQEYSSPGGPYYDYMLELAALLERDHPQVRLKILSYRRNQSQIPPVLPPGVEFPGNVYVVFAHVDNVISADWKHPANAATYDDLLGWCTLTPHVLVWSYPVPYSKGVNLPFSNTRRLVQTLRAMKQAGVEGVYQEYATGRVHHGFGFSELHIYLYYKLAMNAAADVTAVIREFTDHQYGAAAALVREYLDALEEAVATADPPVPMTPVSYEWLAYLTPDRIHAWQKMFNRMESAAAADARCLANVRRLRRNLEFATLLRWGDLAKEHPDDFTDYRIHERRIRDQGHPAEAELADLLTIIQAGGQVKPLPPEFDGIDPARIRQFIPENKGKGPKASARKTVPDADAAFGYAATVYRYYDRDLPFAFGFYQKRIGATEAPWGTAGPQRELNREDIAPGIYRLYKLGTVDVTPQCMIWLQVCQGWATTLEVGPRLHDAANPAPTDNRWEAYVSLKFDGPAYGGDAETNLVVCDRIVLVRKTGNDALSEPK